MSNEEDQGEELEVLQSIYEGDDNFKEVIQNRRLFLIVPSLLLNS